MTEAEVMMVQYDEEAIERWNTELALNTMSTDETDGADGAQKNGSVKLLFP